MDADTEQKIEKYVKNAFTAAQLRENDAVRLEIANASERMAVSGNSCGSAMDHEMIRIHFGKDQ